MASCHSLEITNKVHDCSKDISIEYYRKGFKILTKNKIAEKSEQKVSIFLESYFNGNIQGFIGDQLIFNKNVVTEESIGTTEEFFIYDYSKDTTLPKIKILTEDNCLEFDIKKKYRLVYIYQYNGKWKVIYSNIYPIFQ